MDNFESQRSVMVKVGIFTVTMLLVALGLVVTFGEFRFGPSNTYHANFIDATRLKGNQKVRIAGVPVGAVKEVKLNPNNTVDVAFTVDKRYTLYSSTRALIRYDNLVGDRFLEITSGPGELRKLSPGGTIDQQHTQPALDLDALLGGLRPVLKGLDADKINTISSYVIDLLQGQGGALSNLLANTNAFGSTLGARDHAIGDVITNLNAVLATVDAKGAQFSDTVDQLQKLITGLAEGRDAIAGAIQPLATTTSDLTDLLKHSRRPLQGVLENTPPAGRRDQRPAARGEQRHRATRRGLPPAVRARRLRCVLQHLLLLGVAEDQRPGRQRHHHPDGWPGGSEQRQVRFCQQVAPTAATATHCAPGSSGWSSSCASSWSRSATPSCRSGRKAGPTPPISPTPAGSTPATTSTSPASKSVRCKRLRSPATPPRSPSRWIATSMSETGRWRRSGPRPSSGSARSR